MSPQFYMEIMILLGGLFGAVIYRLIRSQTTPSGTQNFWSPWTAAEAVLASFSQFVVVKLNVVPGEMLKPMFESWLTAFVFATVINGLAGVGIVAAARALIFKWLPETEKVNGNGNGKSTVGHLVLLFGVGLLGVGCAAFGLQSKTVPIDRVEILLWYADVNRLYGRFTALGEIGCLQTTTPAIQQLCTEAKALEEPVKVAVERFKARVRADDFSLAQVDVQQLSEAVSKYGGVLLKLGKLAL